MVKRWSIAGLVALGAAIATVALCTRDRTTPPVTTRHDGGDQPTGTESAAAELDNDGLSETVIIALGRVAWSAINLEGRVQVVCEGILGRDRGRSQIGSLIEDSLVALDRFNPTAAVADLKRWLGEAKRALHTRNAVMHSIPIVAAAEGGSAVDRLMHFPNRGSATVYTPLDASHLNSIADAAQLIHYEWMDVWIPVYEELQQE